MPKNPIIIPSKEHIWGSKATFNPAAIYLNGKGYMFYHRVGGDYVNADMKNREQKVKVAVSGGFDPLHRGHVRLFKEAKKLGDKLIVILNNDNWLKAKKGCAFMPQEERKEIIEALAMVDEVVLTRHSPNPKDMSVCRELEELKPHIFANGGDRHKENIPEVAVCNRINCKMIFNVGAGGKVQSSSWLLENYKKRFIPS